MAKADMVEGMPAEIFLDLVQRPQRHAGCRLKTQLLTALRWCFASGV
jgi:hypothetical protein